MTTPESMAEQIHEKQQQLERLRLENDELSREVAELKRANTAALAALAARDATIAEYSAATIAATAAINKMIGRQA